MSGVWWTSLQQQKCGGSSRAPVLYASEAAGRSHDDGSHDKAALDFAETDVTLGWRMTIGSRAPRVIGCLRPSPWLAPWAMRRLSAASRCFCFFCLFFLLSHDPAAVQQNRCRPPFISKRNPPCHGRGVFGNLVWRPTSCVQRFGLGCGGACFIG